VAGRIREEDIALVRERSRIDEVVSQHVTLRSAGSGSLKGLCPFHDEKSPSFHVTPSRGFYHCFGCGEGGDVLTFMQKVEGLSFAESVERLAGRYGVQLRYTDERGAGAGPRRESGQRARLVEAHRLAAEFYANQLSDSPDAAPGRRFLDERGFDKAAADTFGVGYAPRGGDALLDHLRGKGFRDDELSSAGLVAQSDARRTTASEGGWCGRSATSPAMSSAFGCSPALRRRPGRGEVPQHAGHPDLQEGTGSLRRGSRPPEIARRSQAVVSRATPT
jgi:DNA primase